MVPLCRKKSDIVCTMPANGELYFALLSDAVFQSLRSRADDLELHSPSLRLFRSSGQVRLKSFLLRAWIRAVEKLPLDQEGVRLDDVQALHDGRIIKSSMLALGQIVGMLSENNSRVSSHRRREFGQSALRLVLDLRKRTDLADYSTALWNCLFAGGIKQKPKAEHVEWLDETFRKLYTHAYDRQSVSWLQSAIQTGSCQP